MSGLLLHLSGPLQSWGTEADFDVRPTHRFPTASAMTGLLASALGYARGQKDTDRLSELRYTVRIDRPGTRILDFHTVGGGYPRTSTVMTADGAYKKEGTGTIVTERWYLADAAFTIAVTGPPETITRCADSLARPVFAPYLGRRSCVPDTPILIRDDLQDPVTALDHAPLHRSDRGTPVVFLYDTPPEPDARPEIELRDAPRIGPGVERRYLWQRERHLPDAQDANTATDWINALTSYRRSAP